MPFEFSGDEFSQKVRRAAMRGVVRATELVRKEAIRLVLSGQKSGRLYGKHKASAPGEAPASDTGRLVASIRTEYDLTSVSGKVVVGVPYGLMLEFGTPTMEERPFLRPALANMQDRIAEVIAEEMSRVS